MSAQIISTRQRLINAALELFATQGVTETTTRQIAELAQVNEVTLFRHFGNKHGLLLTVISESPVFKDLGESLQKQIDQTSSAYEGIRNYAGDRLQALEQVPDLILSVLGQARQYPVENRQVLGKYLTQANRYVAEYLTTILAREQLHSKIPVEKLASLLNSLLLGYTVIELTSEFHEIWQNRDEFLENLVELFLNQATLGQGVGGRGAEGLLSQRRAGVEEFETTGVGRGDSGSPLGIGGRGGQGGIASLQVLDDIQSNGFIESLLPDLPASLVHSMLQRAKKSGLRDYALIYVLFGAGLSPAEVVKLERSHQISDTSQHILQITQTPFRQVPVNQWILGKRYGSYTRNPLTQWLKSRKDELAALFLNDVGLPISEREIRDRWQVLAEGLLSPEGLPVIEQAQQTWCVEMLMKGMNLEDLSILTGWNLTKLQSYAQRAKEKLALEQAIRLDRNLNVPSV